MTFPTHLKKLQTELVDALHGYEEALKDSTDGDVTGLFRQMHTLHSAAIAELHDELAAVGVASDEQGSLMSFVHRTVISVRAAITSLGPGSLPSFASGEERILTAYDDAIEETQLYPQITRLLESQKAKLAAMIDRMNAAAVS
jgi:uncharacterized protein (TIGR02284 family)